jgi:hypothetical protein
MFFAFIALLAFSSVTAINDVQEKDPNFAVANSAGGSLRMNNPILLPFALMSWAVAKVAAVDVPVGAAPVVITPDDDDDNGLGAGSDDFEPAIVPPIAFGPITFPQILAIVAVTVLIALWASFDLTTTMMLTGLKYEIIRGNYFTTTDGNGGSTTSYMGYLLPSRGFLRAVLFIEQLAFLVIASIYATQQMVQFLVTASGANSFVVHPASPSVFILAANTWWVFIVFFMYLSQFFWGFSSALIWHGNQFAFAAVVAFVVWLGWIGLIVWSSLELGENNPGQHLGPTYAVLALAIFATIVSTWFLVFAARLAQVMSKDVNKNILKMSDAEARATLSEKRR